MATEVTDEMLTAFREAVRQGGDTTDDIRAAGIAAVLAIAESHAPAPNCCRHCEQARALLAEERPVRRLMTIGPWMNLYDRFASIFGVRP